jgi:hypothetical protein
VREERMNMKKSILSVSLIVLSLVLLRFTPVYGAASNAAEKLTQVLVTNWPDLFKVREQNLDNEGNIKVHEQGTVNVNVTNTEPIAVTGGQPPLQPKTVTLFENRALASTETFTTPVIDVNGYKKLTLYFKRPYDLTNGPRVDLQGYFSIDDTTLYVGTPAIISGIGYGQFARYETVDVVGPKFFINVQNNGIESLSAWVYLMP